jgi:hypothetical protein
MSRDAIKLQLLIVSECHSNEGRWLIPPNADRTYFGGMELNQGYGSSGCLGASASSRRLFKPVLVS